MNKTFGYLTATLILVLPGATLAQSMGASSIYGSVGLGYSDYALTNTIDDPVVGDADDEPDAYGAFQLNATLGMEFSGNWSGELDLEYIYTDVDNNADDAFKSGLTGALRVNYDFGTYSISGFAGGVVTDTDGGDQDTSERFFYGVMGSYDFTNGVTVFGQIGALDGEGGTNSGGDEAIHAATFARIGASYEVIPDLTLTGAYSIANGEMDGNGTIEIDAYLVELSYVFSNPAYSTFLRYESTDYFQENEGDGVREDEISIGFQYNFGGFNANTTREVVPVANWMGMTAGPLE